MTMDSVIEKVLEEHRSITRLLQQILDILDRGLEAMVATGWEELRRQTSDLASHLREHFRLEEEGGFMTPVLELQPTAAPAVEALMQEHHFILERLDSVRQQISDSASPRRTTENPMEALKRVIESLKNHERAEDALIQAVYAQDIGIED